MQNSILLENDSPFDTEDAARYLGCSAGYLKKLRQIGGGPEWHRFGVRKGVHYRRPELDKWLASRRFGSTTEYPENFS